MIVGAAIVELRVHGSRSLKTKRGVVQAIKGRVRNRFNVAIAEVGGQDTWQRTQLGLSTTGSSAQVVRTELQKALEMIEDLRLADVQGSDIELIQMPHEAPMADDDEEGQGAGPAGENDAT